MTASGETAALPAYLPLGLARHGFRGRIESIVVTEGTSDLPPDELERRLIELGFTEGATIEILHEGAVGRDPIAIRSVARSRTVRSAGMAAVIGMTTAAIAVGRGGAVSRRYARRCRRRYEGAQPSNSTAASAISSFMISVLVVGRSAFGQVLFAPRCVDARATFRGFLRAVDFEPVFAGVDIDGEQINDGHAAPRRRARSYFQSARLSGERRFAGPHIPALPRGAGDHGFVLVIDVLSVGRHGDHRGARHFDAQHDALVAVPVVGDPGRRSKSKPRRCV